MALFFRSLLLLLVGLLLASSQTVEQPSDRFEVAKRIHLDPPHPWIHVGKADPAKPLQFSILLKQKNLDQLAQIFRDVSDPQSPKWGEFLTREELDNLVRPDNSVFELFSEWMKPWGNNVQLTLRADSIKVTTTVAAASELLQVPFHIYKHSKTGKKLTRLVGSATIPAHLAEHVDLVVGLSEFFTEKQNTVSYSLFGGKKDDEPRLRQNDVIVTPSVLKNYYKVPSNLVATNSNNYQGIAAFNDYFSMGALRSFEKDQKLPQANVTRIGPDCSPNCDEYESDLDIQYITAMGQNVNTLFVNQDAQYWILQFVNEVLNEINPPPMVFSISYGWAELNQCDIAVVNCASFGYDSKKYVTRTNTEFQKLGSLGVSVLVSDGDDGAPSLGGATGNCPIDPKIYCPVGGCNHTSSACPAITIKTTQSGNLCFVPMGIGSTACQSVLNDKQLNVVLVAFAEKNADCGWNVEVDVQGNPHIYSSCSCSKLRTVTSEGYSISGYVFDQNNGAVFTADYPTSSPYVTAVGATQFDVSGGQIKGEKAASILTGSSITTGGGFSSFQPMPDYQTSVVQSYLSSATNLPPSFTFNPKMRAYPDISFNGHNYKIFYSNDSTDNCPCLATGVDGTSCSAPAFAGLVSLINDQLLNGGKKQLGFMNYLLYQLHGSNPNVFFDVEGGNNKCNRAYCCQYGFVAGKGWDPVIGLGTPNFQNMLSAILAMKGIQQ